MKIIALYVKTHRKTGLKYLGKTITDPFSYRGSGKRWLWHLNKHGDNVTTEVIRWCTDASIRYWGIFYSDLFDVVNSPGWANLKREEGDGGFDHINQADNPYHSHEHLRSMRKKLQDKLDSDPEFRKANNKAISNGLLARSTEVLAQKHLKEKVTKTANGTFGQTWFMQTPQANEKKKQTMKQNQHSQKEKNSQWGTRWVSNGVWNMKIPKDTRAPYGWENKRVMGLPSIDRDLKELFIIESGTDA